ncbi:M50 family metallopeptidase [Nocardioides sp.]|uniref:M50 family metallopeptidase n=1 Tax=Nocardioides sp. TaxID=35761 RepID=UPI003566B3A6
MLLVLHPFSWQRVRLGITVVHEAGHALVALLVGRRLSGIRLHSDTSGLTVSRGRPTGLGMVAMLAAGYLAPALLGLLAAVLLAHGRGVGLLWLLVLLLAVLLVWVRNGYGLVVLLAGAGGLFALTWWGSAQAQSIAAYEVAWLLLLAAPRPLLELLGRGRRGRRTSDPDQLAALTHIPAVLWTLVLLAANAAGLIVGVALLAPDLV